jgi:DNA-binding NarL/FixJ family response regulator
MRALVVDDHPVVVKAVATLVKAMRVEDDDASSPPLFSEVQLAASLEEVFRLLAQIGTIDIAILDLHLGDAQGRASLSAIRERFPDVPVLVFTGDDSIENLTMAFECGARGYATKSSPESTLNYAIRAILAGSSYVPAEAASILAAPRSAPIPPKRALGLSGRQQQVLELLLQGMPNKVIASRLDMAEGTAKAHLNSVFRALGVRTRVEAVLRAKELGII